MNDVNHCAGEGIETERHLFLTGDMRLKRFFDEDDVRAFFGAFDIEYLAEECMLRYEAPKMLFRCCAKNIK